MAQTLTRNNIKAGHTFYVINNSDQLEMYRVIKKKGTRIALVSEGGPLQPEAAAAVLNSVTKFRTANGVKRYAKLNAMHLS